MRTITRWKNGNKVQIETESTPYNADRAREILDAPYGNYDVVMTDGEIAYTKDLWDKMPGHTCFYDAICRIYQNRIDNRGPACRTCEPYQTGLGKGFIRNAHQIIQCPTCNNSGPYRRIK